LENYFNYFLNSDFNYFIINVFFFGTKKRRKNKKLRGPGCLLDLRAEDGSDLAGGDPRYEDVMGGME
jgi:hypothetical protein